MWMGQTSSIEFLELMTQFDWLLFQEANTDVDDINNVRKVMNSLNHFSEWHNRLN